MIDDVGLRRPTLDDVFLTLTGHAAEADTSDEDELPSPGRSDERGSASPSPTASSSAGAT